MKELRLGIIGAGLITARSHLPAALALPEIRVRALVDPVAERAQELATSAGAPDDLIVATQLDAILDEVDAVLIATPNDTHADLAIASMRRGVHVLIEKPLATRSSDGEAIAEAATSTGCVAGVGFCTRFQPGVALMRHLLEKRFFGKVRRFAYQMGGTDGWDSASAFHLNRGAVGGGVLVTQGVHFLDRMLWWFGIPQETRLEDDSLGGPEANAVARFSYEGFEGSARFSKTAALASGFAMDTERGIVTLREDREARIHFHSHEFPEIAQILDGPELSAGRGVSNVFQRQLRDFAQACQDGADPLIPIAQGLDVIRLVEDLYQHRTPLVSAHDDGAAEERAEA